MAKSFLVPGAGGEIRPEMPARLAVEFEVLRGDLIWLHMRWAMYAQLFERGRDRVDLLNETAPAFFYVVQRSLWDDVVLGLTKLTDQPRSGDRKTLCLRSLASAVDEPIRGPVCELVRAAELACVNHLDLWRNKQIAHRDSALALGTSARALPTVGRPEIEAALTSCAEVMNYVEYQYANSTTAYVLSDPGALGPEGVVTYLTMGREVERGNTASLHGGACGW